MSEQYPGGFISKTPPTPDGTTAQGMWTLSQAAGYQKQGLWPLPPLSSFTAGTQANAATLQMQRSSIASLSSSSFIYAYVGYNTGSGDANIYAVVGTVSGTTITYGTPVIVRSGLSPQSVYVSALSATSAIVTYPNASSVWAGTALVISGTSISAGGETSNSLTCYDVVSAPLSSTTALVICNSTSGIKASVATVSGTSLSWGSTTSSMSSVNGNNYATISSASSSTGMVAYIPTSGSNFGKPCAVAMTVSGGTVSYGSETVLDSGQAGTSWQPGICSVTTTSAIFAYGDSTTSYLKSVGMTISGTTITAGTPVTLTAYDAGTSNSDAGPIITRTANTQALLVTRNASSHALGQFLNIDGTSVTSSSTSTILASSSRAPTITYLGSNKAVAGYGDSTTYISAKVLTLS
jgi:hypothetical protein